MDRGTGRSTFLLTVALLLVFGGGAIGGLVQSDFGAVRVQDVRFPVADGRVMHAKLYRPNGATAEAPAPGVLAIHGYINTNETQSPYAIELARRGYVVLAVDQPGHGYSDPPAFAGGFGGPESLAYLRSLAFVDPEQVVLSGHSMGGWAVLIAAAVAPGDYTSIVVSGSSTGTFGAPEGTPTYPRNLGLVYSTYDEFSELMWGAPTGAEAPATAKMQALFGTDAPVEPGRLYGDLDAGTARQLYAPAVTHPGDHITTAGVAPVIDWVQRTTDAPYPLPASDQVWMWKEAGTAIALVGFVLALFAVAGLLLDSRAFTPLANHTAPAAGVAGFGWWLGAAIAAVIPAVTFFWAQNQTNAWLTPDRWFPQQITNGLVGWALFNGAVSLVLVLLWFAVAGRRNGARWDTLGLRVGGFFRAIAFAVAVVGSGYALLALSNGLFHTDFRFWVVAVKLLSTQQAQIALVYLLPFTAFYLVFGMVLHGQLRPRGSAGEGADAMIANALIAVGGFLVLLGVQYLALFSGRPLPFGEPLLTIVAFQLLFLMPVTAMLSTYLFQRTGSVWPGAWTNGLLVTWYVIASQATHFAG
ncbi:MAG: alpha/beta fold hydrolase [Trueperaceae bacterium]|nr:alpha/beta fold hydrolase [Trueperaceae bacterium]